MKSVTHACAALIGALWMFGCASQPVTTQNDPAQTPATIEESITAADPGLFPDLSVSEALQRVPGVSVAGSNEVEEESIVVTGMRASLRSSMDIKRSANGSVDSITTNNIGQFSPPAIEENTERYEHAAVNPIRQVAAEPVSTFSIDVDTASYTNVRRFLQGGGLPPPDAVRIEEMINYFDYDYAGPRNARTPFATHVSVTPSPWAEGRLLMHIGLQGYEPPQRDRPPLNLVLLVDVSGSMNSDDKLPLAIEGFRLLTEQLTARDRLSIVVYAGAAGAVLQPTSGADRTAILSALNRLEAGGSTAGGAGLALAYSLAEQNFDRNAINRIILATDGDFNVGVTDDESLEGFIARKRLTGIYLSVLGFGGGNYNDALMQRLAQNGNGVAAYIDGRAEARRVLSEQLGASMQPIANDVKIQVEFNPARVAEYRLIGYETRMLAREDFNNDQIDAGEIGAGHSVTAIYEITPVGGPTFAEPLRYQPSAAPAANSGEEFAFLRIRYKTPGDNESQLIERPIDRRDQVTQLARAPESTRWAVAVAAYGQRLRGDPYMGAAYSWADIAALARGARGEDAFGWRAEFLELTAQAERFSPPRLAQNTAH